LLMEVKRAVRTTNGSNYISGTLTLKKVRS
jgi:hypothetical protein